MNSSPKEAAVPASQFLPLPTFHRAWPKSAGAITGAGNDLAGNCRLSVPGAFYLEASGNEPVHGRPTPSANLSSAESARILRVILTPDNIGMKWTQRDNQRHCAPAVSLGLVNKVVRYLRDQAFIEEVGDEGLRLRDPLGLLKAWCEAYRFDRHWRRTYFTLLQGRKLQELFSTIGKYYGRTCRLCRIFGSRIPSAACETIQNMALHRLKL